MMDYVTGWRDAQLSVLMELDKHKKLLLDGAPAGGTHKRVLEGVMDGVLGVVAGMKGPDDAE